MQPLPLPGQPEPWMTTHARVFAALGAPDRDVRFVGGIVRNRLLGEPLGDVDIGTPDTPGVVLERLARAGLKAVPTGLDHGTVTAVDGGLTYEITTLRRDTACDGRHAAVEFTEDWIEDAGRRDFTINAMSLAPDGTLFDYHGGVEDARAGKVRFVGDPADRIREDYLRILRLFRFQARYGRSDIDNATLEAVRLHAKGLARLSAERIVRELAKLLEAKNPAPVVGVMTTTGVLGEVLPEAQAGPALARLVAREHETPSPGDWLRRFAVLLPEDTGGVAARLKLSNVQAQRLAVLAAHEPVLGPATSSTDLNRALYRLGQGVVIDRLLIGWARDGDDPAWKTQLARANGWTEKTFPVSGADVLALGIEPGPRVGELLRAAEDFWIGGGFAPDREGMLGYLKERAGK